MTRRRPPSREVIDIRDTEPMEGKASPLKPKGCDRREIVSGQLGRGMARDGQREIVADMPKPSSTTRMRRWPPPAVNDLDAPRAGVDGVLDKLLDRARRPLDDLACGDAVDKDPGKGANGHGRRHRS